LQIGLVMLPILSVLKEYRSLFVTTLADLAAQYSITDIHIGMTDWSDTPDYRMSTEVFAQIENLTQTTQWKLHQMQTSLSDEARYEAMAVDFVACRNNLPDTDLLIGSGGGSVQISSDISTSRIQLFGIANGFKDGQDKLMSEGMGAFDEIDQSWKQHLTLFLEKEAGRFVIKPNSNMIAISACCHAAKFVGLKEMERLECPHVIKKFKERRDNLCAQLKASSKNLSKKDAMDVVNLTIQIHLLENLSHPTSNIRFCRNWKINGSPFQSTWAVGWYLELMEKYEPSNKKVPDAQ